MDNFAREIKIDSEATFLDFYHAIIHSVGYTSDQMCSFFICDDDWSKKTEVTLVDMGTSSEEDSFIMEDTPLEELVEDEDQRLLFVFDYLTERAVFIELREIIPGKTLDEPICTLSEGLPPTQTVDFEEVESKGKSSPGYILGEDFYGDSEYDIDELDSQGFEGLDNIPDNSFGEDRY
jgi:hypothetical protein